MRPFRRRTVAALAGILSVASFMTWMPRADAALPAPAPAVDRSFQPGVLLVAFTPNVDDAARAALHATNGTTVTNQLDWLDLDVVRLPEGVDPRTAAVAYEASPLVSYAEPNYVFHIDSIPNDSFFSDMYGLHNTGQTGGTPDADIDAPETWTTAFGAGNFPSTGGVRVGVVDTGIDTTNPDIGGKVKACANATSGVGLVVSGSCADDAGHGTHVAGTIAAFTNNGSAVAGVAPNAELAICKALNASGLGLVTDIVACIRWLRTTGGARIISMSLSGETTAAMNAELTAAYSSGVLLVAAAGNEGTTQTDFPAGHADVISVAATDHNDAHASFSNCNSDVEIAAPGVDIISTFPGAGLLVATMSGTSMATPHVAGAAALVMWKKGFTAAQTRTALNSTVNDKGPAGRDNCFGFGRLNLANAVA